MNSLFQAGLELQQFMMEKKWPFCELKEAPEIVDKLQKLIKHFRGEG